MFEKFSPAEVPRHSAVSVAEFQHRYRAKAKPVILPSLTQHWPATQKWNLDYLRAQLGELVVPVYSSKPAIGKQHQHAAARHLPLREYLDLLEQGENDLRVFFYNILQNAPQMLDDFQYPELGMKFFKRLPVLFIGGAGTRVQMHYDIDLANLLLCHFGGPKTVLLFAPEETPHLYKVPWSFSSLHSIDYRHPDFAQFPNLRNAKAQVARLRHGDALYIPSGYWHYVVYEEIGFSMTLRSMPTTIRAQLTLMKNIFLVRSVEGVMRKLIGQKWVERNEALAMK